MKNVYFLLFVIAVDCHAQSEYGIYDNFFAKYFEQGNIFKRVKGSFTPGDFVKYKTGYGEKKTNYSYKFNNITVNLKYFYPKSIKDTGCGYFVINKLRFDLFGRFENDFACELDVESFKVYRGTFSKRNYLLLTCINTGNGGFGSTVICNLFDITDPNLIKYYPLWSKYGSSSFFGDFNHDGKLDFIKSRIYNGQEDQIVFDLLSLNNERFVKDNSDNHKIILNIKAGDIKIVKKQWY